MNIAPILTAAVQADVASALAGIFVGLISLALTGFFIFWTIRFLIEVPRYLKRIAEALEQLADK